MKRYLFRNPAIILLLLFLAPFSIEAEVLEVRNLNGSGSNSLRDRIENDAAANDTVWINVSGTISLSSSISINTPVTILGPMPTHLTIDAGGGNRHFVVDHPNAKTWIRGVRLVNGNSGTDPGGSILVKEGTLRLRHTLIENNKAEANGGAIANMDTLYANYTSFLNCSTQTSGNGGALYSSGGFWTKNSTYSLNYASGNGGAIVNDSGYGDVKQSTIIHNSALDNGGGIVGIDPDYFYLETTIVEYNEAGISGPNMYTPSSDTIDSYGYNLIYDTTGANFNAGAGDILQGAGTSGLSDSSAIDTNGYGFKYYTLGSGSDAIDAGPTVSPSADQRLAPRPIDGDKDGNNDRDIGSVEYTPYQVDASSSLFGTTLGDAVADINSRSAPPYYISFELNKDSIIDHSSLSGPYSLSQRVVIDGWSHPESEVPGPNDPSNPSAQVSKGSPVVQVDGDILGISDGFVFNAGAERSILRGLSIKGHTTTGITIEADTVRVNGNHIGVGPSGDGSEGKKNKDNGIRVTNSASWSLIGGIRHFQRNVFGLPEPRHIYVTMDAGKYHRIHGNFIGIAANGVDTVSGGGGVTGVHLQNIQSFVGADRLAGKNIISGNSSEGVLLDGLNFAAEGNWVAYNRIGTTYEGRDTVPNRTGVSFIFSRGNRLYKNQISGNSLDGVFFDVDSDSNIVRGNFIGTGPNGDSALGNQEHGIYFTSDALPQLIGGALHSDSSNVISGNKLSGIRLKGYGHKIHGNLIGTGSSGLKRVPNGEYGIDARSSGPNEIGGVLGQKGNIISGNKLSGIREVGSGSLIRGNFIGVDSTRKDTLGNGEHGIYLDQPTYRVQIGDTLRKFGNTIGGNAKNGIRIENGSFYQGGHLVGNNFIGVDSADATQLGNNFSGVVVNGDSNKIGSPKGYGNYIAYNGGAGIRMDSSRVGNSFSRNRIHNNGDLGIDLAADGVTPNDAGDSDSGPNELRNHPELLNYSKCGNQLNVKFAYKGIPTEIFRVEFFKVFAGNSDPSGHGEGDRYLGADTITMPSTSPDTFTISFNPVNPIDPSDSLTATMTDTSGHSTSEFAANITGADSLYLALDSIDHVTCAGDSNGAAYVTPHGGVEPYQVTWYDSAYSVTVGSDTTLINVNGGTYNAVLEGALGCTDTLQVVIDEPDTLKTQAKVIMNESCKDSCDGKLYADVSGGTTPYTISWDSLGTGNTLYTDTVKNACDGNYPHSVVDSNGCKDSVNWGYVSPGDSIDVTVSNDTNICQGDSAQLSITSADPASTIYSWSPATGLSDTSIQYPKASPDTTITYIGEGSVDSTGCSDTGSVKVSVDSIPIADAGPDTAVCLGDSVLIGDDSTSQGSDLVYDWSSGASLSDSTVRKPKASPLTSTTYELFVNDTASGCSSSDSVLVDAFSNVTASAGSDTSICHGDTVTLGGSPVASGGSGKYSYTWTPFDSLSSFSDSTPQAFPGTTTSYQLVVKDSMTTCLDVDSITVIVDSLPELDLSAPDSICQGDTAVLAASGTSDSLWWNIGTNKDSIRVTPTVNTFYYVKGTDTITGCSSDTGTIVVVDSVPSVILSGPDSICEGDTAFLDGVGASSYVWQDSSTGNSYSDVPDSTKLYWVEGSNAAGCSDRDSLTVKVQPAPSAPTSSKTSYVICSGDSAPKIGVDSNASYQNAWYSQPDPSGLIAKGDSLGGISLSGDSLYRYAALKDTVNGCVGPSLDFLLRRFDSSTVSVSPDTGICVGESVDLKASGGTSYKWSPTEKLDDSTASQVTASPDQDVTYSVTITSANGCQVEDSVRVDISVSGECGLEVYNAFSPNEDGVNEKWIIEGIRAYPENEVTIFNRWGDRLIKIEGYDNQEKAWDGKRANGNRLPEGTYYYIIKLNGDQQQELKGYVQLTR